MALEAADTPLGARILKVNHAREHGAVHIYAGQILVARLTAPSLVPELLEFKRHEERHRSIFEAELHRRNAHRCKSYWLCAVGGYALASAGSLARTLGRRTNVPQPLYAMPSPRLVASFFPLAAVVFSAAFIAVEHFTGGVKTHHFLAREDLPGFSNWLSLFILPVLGMIVGFRAHALCLKQTVRKLPAEFTAAVAGSLLYGAILACSFLFGFEQVTVAMFFSLFLISIVFPVYRSEYSFGFVTGMTIAFGSVIPLAFSAVFSAASFVARRVATLVVTAIRKPRR